MAAPTLKGYDWELGTFGARLVPYSLLPNGSNAHEVEPIPFLAQQISSQAELSYSDISREVEVAFAQDDLSGGCAYLPRFGSERSTQFRWSKGIDTSWPEYLLPAPKVIPLGAVIATKPTVAVQRGNIVYVGAGVNLYQVTNSSTVTLDTTFAADITDLKVILGKLVVGLGDSTNFRYRTADTGVFTDGTVTGRHFASETYRVWRSVRPNSVWSADDITGPWTEYKVGDPLYNINSLTTLNTSTADGTPLVIGKDDGPYGFDQNSIGFNIAPELGLQADTRMCSVALNFNRDFVFNTRAGIVSIGGEGFKTIGLDLLADPALPSGNSAISAMATDNRFLYALVVQGNGIYIWKRDFKGAWHNYIYRSDLGAAADLLFATGKLGSTVINAVLFAYSSGANWQLAYANFATTYNPLKDTAYKFEDAQDGSLRTLDYVANLPTVPKFTDRIKVVGDNFGGSRFVTVTVYPDSDVAKQAGTFSVSPFFERNLTTPAQYHRLSLELRVTSQSQTTVPQVRAFHASASYITRVVRKHTCHFLAASFIPLLTGGRARNDVQDIVQKFRDIRAEQALITCKDEDGRTFEAQLIDIWERQIQPRNGPDSKSVKVLTAVLKEVVKV